ncbi:Eco57I restriction-modification methylase domain-containing protein [Picosynechococcus sp. PCC 7003]|uniref:Eco57I restriction-modification methylase domain-containing protein n=1 Tax=Picosynechococcus sp. PCC 7003 TaxID=374981 RepID=UPI001E2AD99D|nr:DNA methyltransferase [Picosynechococcus sp. PCC 7003]
MGDSPRKNVNGGGGFADAALGLFTATTGKKGEVKLTGRIVAPIELKGAKVNLDHAPKGKESPVHQGWRYANYTEGCQWILVSNYQEIRLYHTLKTPSNYECFFLKDLANLAVFKRFYFLLCRQNFLPKATQPNTETVIDKLLKTSEAKEEEITNDLYKEYKNVRQRLVQHFRDTAPTDLQDKNAAIIEAAQRILDRVLFVAFCEDRLLLPNNTLKEAHDYKDPYNPQPIWHNYKAVFRWVDQGNDNPPIAGYNGGLFKPDPLVDQLLTVPDELCTSFKELTRFDFDSEVSVNVLGHIFEQSVTDLEELQAIANHQPYDAKKGKRKKDGVFYTPAWVTTYIVETTIGEYLEQKKEAIWERPEIKKLRSFDAKNRKFWQIYIKEILQKIRILDPACGSGAFLIAALQFLQRKYQEANENLAQYQKTQNTPDLFDLSSLILTQNLYGVDLSAESVEITKLSLWLHTAEKGQRLTNLDGNIKAGNSIVADTQYDPKAFDWEKAFPEVMADGGFDVVIGNPPYVRQELLSPFKPYLEQHYECYDGVADLYVYFYEKGVKLLKPQGMMSYIVTNKWLRAGYGEPLRKFFAEKTEVEQIIDFGHAPIFKDADTFPCIVVVKKPEEKKAATPKSPTLICPVPRERLADLNLTQYVNNEGYQVKQDRFSHGAWSLERQEVDDLMAKIRAIGIPLKGFLKEQLLCGIKTGFNNAYLIDDIKRQKLVNSDPKANNLIVPYFRGNGLSRWHTLHDQTYLILIKSSANHLWEWSQAQNISSAEDIFRNSFPSIYSHFIEYKTDLKKRSDQGLFWWELRSCAYYDTFTQANIFWKDLSFNSQFCLSLENSIPEMTCFCLETNDLWKLGILNSPLMWSYLWRNTPHGKDEALRLKKKYMLNIPIVEPLDSIRVETEERVSELIELTKLNQEAYRDVLDWLRVEMNIEKIGNKLEDFSALSIEDFKQEIKKRRPKGSSLSIAQNKELTNAYNEYAPQIQQRKAEILAHEIRVSDLVNQAYQLTPEEIALMWKTAPPRMPIPAPKF